MVFDSRRAVKVASYSLTVRGAKVVGAPVALDFIRGLRIIPAPMPLAQGTKLGPYEVQSQIGAGGMGEVYKARDTRLNRDVALKILPDSFANDAERLRRFEQETQAVAGLNHPNIVAIYDVGTRDNTPFLMSELLDGESLRALLERRPIPQRKAIECAEAIQNR
jgi:eukaryotic-like serine/threonine-protein kinase